MRKLALCVSLLVSILGAFIHPAQAAPPRAEQILRAARTAIVLALSPLLAVGAEATTQPVAVGGGGAGIGRPAGLQRAAVGRLAVTGAQFEHEVLAAEGADERILATLLLALPLAQRVLGRGRRGQGEQGGGGDEGGESDLADVHGPPLPRSAVV